MYWIPTKSMHIVVTASPNPRYTNMSNTYLQEANFNRCADESLKAIKQHCGNFSDFKFNIFLNLLDHIRTIPFFLFVKQFGRGIFHYFFILIQFKQSNEGNIFLNYAFKLEMMKFRSFIFEFLKI